MRPGEQLLDIVEAWARARTVEDFFLAVTAKTSTLEVEEQEVLQSRVDAVGEMLGGIDVLQYFRTWKAPEEPWAFLYRMLHGGFVFQGARRCSRMQL